MAIIAFRSTNFRKDSLTKINTMIEIVADYTAQGLRLTARQLYYQLVSRNIIPNTEKSYKSLTGLLADARYAGMIDWDAIEDRGREPSIPLEFDSIEHRVQSALRNYRLRRWADQDSYCELWCFPPETTVIGDGWVKPISLVEVGDPVIDSLGRREHVTDIMSRNFVGELVQIKVAGLPAFSCTEKHEIMVNVQDPEKRYLKGARKQYTGIEFVLASAISPGDLLMVPRFLKSQKHRPFYVPGGPRSRAITLECDYLLAQTIGFFLAEGGVRIDARTVQFVFNKTEIEYASIIERFAHGIGLNTDRRQGAGTCIILVFGKALADWLVDNFGNGAFDKKLPSWVLRMPVDWQMEMLRCYFLGDGAKPEPTHPGWSAGTRSYVLAWQIHGLLLRAGYAATIYNGEDHELPMYHVGVSGASGREFSSVLGIDIPIGDRSFNHIALDDLFAYFPVRTVERKPYAGKVFNLTISNSHTYCIPCVVHNCEKQALAGVLAPLAAEFHVTLMVNKGYSSASAMFDAAQRYIQRQKQGKQLYLFYLGDHDPSGEDMVRDVATRLEEFGVQDMTMVKIALTMAQVEEYDPPPNPAKTTDSRYVKYEAQHGDKSWEVDALPPNVLQQLIREALERQLDRVAWDEVLEREESDKARLREAAKNITQDDEEDDE